MAAGFRSPLPPLGLSAPPVGAQHGFASMLAFWAGGVGRAIPQTQAGVRSMLGFWMGGICLRATATATATATVIGDGLDPVRLRRRRRMGIEGKEAALRDERDIGDFICIWTLLNDRNR